MTPRDPEATKARIFDAATSEFAAYGIAGARVDRIARNAKANKQLIYAYFGDKQALFQQVLEKAMVDVAAAVTTDISDLDNWIDQHLDYHRAHPEFLRLQMWEALEVGAKDAVAGEQRAARYADKKDKVADAQRRGLIRDDLPAGQVLTLLMGLMNYSEAVPQVRRFLVGDDFDPDGLRPVIKDAARRAVAAPDES
ncbi:AcrR family transcriptional regulator [Nocardia transvalensis]|uniref:AcrR family transcriptional regulator n=1 Tax=Nocardia transvalensis TaxID=37333 RepID=A0A7W9UIX9_9NOCA|nr:TetR family transcriptional regulator [Nocardia transvalensis]MBB5914854.1 AcrR family transcriptional regulator [Nocardia transvalensis]